MESISPSHNPSSLNYLYGDNMVTVGVTNNGNMTAKDLELELQIFKSSNVLTQYCEIECSLSKSAKKLRF